MIPAIGYMIGFYILTRMFSILFPNKEPERPFIIIFAAITILVVILCLAMLGISELNSAKTLNDFNFN